MNRIWGDQICQYHHTANDQMSLRQHTYPWGLLSRYWLFATLPTMKDECNTNKIDHRGKHMWENILHEGAALTVCWARRGERGRAPCGSCFFLVGVS